MRNIILLSTLFLLTGWKSYSQGVTISLGDVTVCNNETMASIPLVIDYSGDIGAFQFSIEFGDAGL